MRVIDRKKGIFYVEETVKYASAEEQNLNILIRRKSKWKIKRHLGNIITYRRKRWKSRLSIYIEKLRAKRKAVT